MLLWILIILAVVFFAGGFGSRGHARYGSYSNGGIGLGTILIIIVIILLVTGNLHL